MIRTVTKTYGTAYFPVSFTYEVSDFKDGEQPMHTGFKRKRRKPRELRLSKNDYRPYKNTLSFCWKDQRKSRHQYKTIVLA